MTASGSRLTIDYRNVMDEAIGSEHGLSAAEIASLAPDVAAAHERIWSEHAAGEQKWLDLPDNSVLADEISAYAAEVAEQYDDYLLVGIGGSSLGAIATIQALAHPHRNHFHVRIYCPAEDVTSDRRSTCRDRGPYWPWLPSTHPWQARVVPLPGYPPREEVAVATPRRRSRTPRP